MKNVFAALSVWVLVNGIFDSASAQDVQKKYELVYSRAYTVMNDQLMNNWDRVLAAIPSEVIVSQTPTEIVQKDLRGGHFTMQAVEVSLTIRVTAEEFARGMIGWSKKSSISNPTFASTFAASLTRLDRGISMRPAGTVETRRLFPDISFFMEFETHRADNAEEVKQEILSSLNNEWPTVDRLWRLSFPNYLSLLRTDPGEAMINDAIPNEFVQSVEEFTRPYTDPATKEPGIVFGETKSLFLTVTSTDLDAGVKVLKKKTPAFYDDESAHRLASYLTKPELGISVSAEDLLGENGQKRGVIQTWTIDLTKAANYKEVQAKRGE